MRIDVCIVTYRRPAGLQRLLGALQQQEFPGEAPALRVVVVDNDPQESARSVCEDARSWLTPSLSYVMEKRRGIPQARNSAVAACLKRSEFLAFVDDDEVPDPDWLAELQRVQRLRDADAVAGPCLPRFYGSPPRWIAQGRFFESPRHTTGERIDHAFTHNVLVRTAALADMEALFDERMALTGGSDAEFFRRFARTGHRIVWADDARVFEWVPETRARLGWLLARAFRVGCSSAWIARRSDRPPTAVAWMLANGVWCIAKGAWQLALALPRGRAAAVHALRLACDGAGRLWSLAGLSYREYRTTHGR